MGSTMLHAVWLVIAIASSTACYHFGYSLGTQKLSAAHRQTLATQAFSDARRALEALQSADGGRSIHLSNLRTAVFRLGEHAEGTGMSCAAEDRDNLKKAVNILQADPGAPEWMRSRLAPMLTLCQ